MSTLCLANSPPFTKETREDVHVYNVPNTQYFVWLDSPGHIFRLQSYQQLFDQQQIYLHDKIIRGQGDVVQSYENTLNRIQLDFQAGPWPISAADLQIVFRSIERETTLHPRYPWLQPREYEYWICWYPAPFSGGQFRGNGSISRLLP